MKNTSSSKRTASKPFVVREAWLNRVNGTAFVVEAEGGVWWAGNDGLIPATGRAADREADGWTRMTGDLGVLEVRTTTGLRRYLTVAGREHKFAWL